MYYLSNFSHEINRSVRRITMAPKPKKKQVVQKSLEQVGQLQTLKKPHEAIGKTIGVIGSHWGSACPAGDKDKIFKCTIKDFTLLHVFSPTEKGPAMQLIEMGTDGQGGNSAVFWMGYPYPFLTFWYNTFPTVATATKAGGPAPPAEGAEGSLTAEELRVRTTVYQYLEPVSSTRNNGRTVNCFTCKVVTRVKGCASEIDKVCGGRVTLFGKSTGPFFKHVRRAAARGCEAHQASLEILNLSSTRQAPHPSARQLLTAMSLHPLSTLTTAPCLCSLLAAPRRFATVPGNGCLCSPLKSLSRITCAFVGWWPAAYPLT